MNLQYKNLCEWGKLHRKLKDVNRGWHWNKPSSDEIEGWRLQMFTCEKNAKEESEHNLQQLKAKAQEIESPVLILKGNEIIFAGTEYAVASTDLTSDEWLDDFEANRKSKYYSARPFWTHQVSEYDRHEFSMSAYGSDYIFTRPPQCGFYLVDEDKKLTNRREQIQTLWNLGFVARRGRPITVGNVRHCGTPSDVQLATDLAQRFWKRRCDSEVAKKACQIYTSINRDFCWPGSW